MTLFKIHRGNQEKAKANFDLCQVRSGENKLDGMQRDLKEQKRNSDVCKVKCRERKR